MKTLAWLWLPVALGAAPFRVARVGELDGKVEVQFHAADSWRPAVRNTPLVESTWIRTAASGRVEIELDDGSALRLVGDALCELSDYTRLSTGQRVTLVSLDHGLAYFTGQPARRDALILAVPGAQATVRSGVRARLEVNQDASQIAVLEGNVRFSSPAAELDLPEGQTARTEAANQARFFLYREITPLDADRWDEQRDRLLASTTSSRHVPGLHYGLVDLDANGTWIQTADYGLVWKPKVSEGWVPYRDGHWLWYDETGFTWIANESWGWLPFHYGRWIEPSGIGWAWVPGKTLTFKPGEVYWLRQTNLIGWGPLAPGESWDARAVPRLYLRINTTLARWTADARELIPAESEEKLKTTNAAFTVAPPSPAFDSARLEAQRPVLRAGSTRIVPVLPGVTFEPSSELAAQMAPVAQPQQASAQPQVTDSAEDGGPNSAPRAAVYVPVPEPVEVYYPVPVYSSIVVVNPPEQRPHRREHPSPPPPSSSQPPAVPTPGQTGLTGMPRGESRDPRAAPPSHPSPPAPPAVVPAVPALPVHHTAEPPSHAGGSSGTAPPHSTAPAPSTPAPSPPPAAPTPAAPPPAHSQPSSGSSRSSDDAGSHSDKGSGKKGA